MQKSDLPKPLQTLLDISKVNRIQINLSKKDNDDTPSLISKIGGIGYLPMGEHYPTTSDGTPLVLLAQLNFRQISETVDISQLPHPLPKQGILQIYIDGQDDLYGCDLDDYLPHEKYQVRFWQDETLPLNTDELTKISEQLQSLEIDYLPFDAHHQYTMNFILNTQSCGTNCFEYNHISQQIDELKDCDVWNYLEEDLGIDDPDEYFDVYDECSGINEHQILGYPNFTQTDPREYNEHLQGHILLLQIETDDMGENDIMWGDSGVANFFIHPDDLKNQDFSKLVYNWDCC
ncbi:MAG: DUF1963 domain-containing protein [Moraxella sp.]|nr:DUF1963 domain-containing protein [Moraxella sp.]